MNETLFSFTTDFQSVELMALFLSKLLYILLRAQAEAGRAQTLFLSLEITPQRSFASLQDDIEKTVDYDRVATRVVQLAEDHPRKLIETLADEVAVMVLSEFPAVAVSVEIEKHILPETDAVLVRTCRVR